MSMVTIVTIIVPLLVFCNQYYYFTELNISGNKLHTLPDELRNLQELQNLDASSNNLDRIPQVVFQCVQLKQLNVHSNCISGL